LTFHSKIKAFLKLYKDSIDTDKCSASGYLLYYHVLSILYVK